jgi:hypothetical protein
MNTFKTKLLLSAGALAICQLVVFPVARGAEPSAFDGLFGRHPDGSYVCVSGIDGAAGRLFRAEPSPAKYGVDVGAWGLRTEYFRSTITIRGIPKAEGALTCLQSRNMQGPNQDWAYSCSGLTKSRLMYLSEIGFRFENDNCH